MIDLRVYYGVHYLLVYIKFCFNCF